MERLEFNCLGRLPADAFDQISNLINEYNTNHPGEMLSKTPDRLREIYKSGLSEILILPENPELVIAHAGLYPFGLQELTGGLELYEVGSFIVHPNFRHRRIDGLTIGEFILQKLLKGRNEEPIIATVKRQNTLRAFERFSFKPIPFCDFPIVTSLTCTCPTSEHFNNLNCPHRAKIPGEKFSNNGLNNEPPKIACTLMGYNLEKLKELEERIAQKLGLIIEGLINPSFFSEVGNQLNRFGINLL